jgi:hypothetical protein
MFTTPPSSAAVEIESQMITTSSHESGIEMVISDSHIRDISEDYSPHCRHGHTVLLIAEIYQENSHNNNNTHT